MLRWEYQVQDDDDIDFAIGKEGWELVSVIAWEYKDRDDFDCIAKRYYFKRPLEENVKTNKQ